MLTKLLILLLCESLCLCGQTRINLQNQSRAGAGTVLPATCTPGQTFYKSDSLLLYTCTTPNTWTLGSGGSGGNACTASSPSFSTTPTFDLSANPCVIVPGVMSGNVSAVAFSHTTAGQKVSITWTQPSSGGPYSVTYGGSTFGTCGIWGSPNSTIVQNLQVQPDGVTMRGVDCLTSESYTEFPEAALPSIGKAGSDLVQGNSATHTLYCNSNNGGWVPCFGGPIASGIADLGTSPIAAAACVTVTVSAPGVLSTDRINANPNASIKAVTGYIASSSGGLAITNFPSVDNVNFDVCNWSSGSITPGAVRLNWDVSRN